MDFYTFLILYLISVLIFFIADMIWLGILARGFYQKHLGHLLGEVKWGVAIVFYLLYIVGITYFSSYPAYTEENIFKAFLVGGLFGLFTYATYDLTNFATLKKWPAVVVFPDILWGTLLGSVVSGFAVGLLLLIF